MSRNAFLIIALSLLVVIFAPSVYAWTVECEGYDSDTGEYVSGECTDGEFEGYDSDTGEYVYGECSRGGDLEAYNSDTGEYVYGECESG